jgi:putative transposase
MPRYRRNFVPGGSYFFTVNLADRREHLLTDHVDALRAAFRYARSRHPFTIEAIVILPEHLHAIWTLPDAEADFATRWRLIKSAFTRAVLRHPPVGWVERGKNHLSRFNKGERGVWQRRYWEHTLRNEDDFARHADYIHFNPVKHGHAQRVRDWPYSSFHRMVRLGVYPLDWAGDVRNGDGNFGERK